MLNLSPSYIQEVCYQLKLEYIEILNSHFHKAVVKCSETNLFIHD